MLPYDNYYYNRFGSHLKNRYGEKVHKISVDGGFDCPNRVAGATETGCAWCENSSFNPNPRSKERTVHEQTELGVKILRKRLGVRLYIAYFQAYSNTNASCNELYKLYKEALSVEGIIGIAIGTRPDCVDEEKLSMIEELAKDKLIQIEYGLQTSNDGTLQSMNRGHTTGQYIEAMNMSKGRGIELCTHMITGLPGETAEDSRNTLQTAIKAGTDGIKIHNLHIVKGSRLGREYLKNPFKIPTEEEHVNLVCDLLEETPPEIIIHRLWGASASKEKHIAPDWCLDHNRVRYAIEQEFERRKTYQGYRV